MGIYSLQIRHQDTKTCHTGIGMPIINLRRSDDRLRFMKGILIPIWRCLFSEWWTLSTKKTPSARKTSNSNGHCDESTIHGIQRFFSLGENIFLLIRCQTPPAIDTRWEVNSANGPLTRYVKLQVAHAPGMPGTFSPAADFKGNR